MKLLPWCLLQGQLVVAVVVAVVQIPNHFAATGQAVSIRKYMLILFDKENWAYAYSTKTHYTNVDNPVGILLKAVIHYNNRTNNNMHNKPKINTVT